MSYSRQKEVLEMPNLIEVQRDSYEWFLTSGLREVLDDICLLYTSSEYPAVIMPLVSGVQMLMTRNLLYTGEMCIRDRNRRVGKCG